MPKQTPIIIAVVAILLIAAGAYLVLGKKSQTPQTSSTNTTTEQKSEDSGSIKSSIKSLLGGGKNVMCTVKYPTADQSAEGTIYVSSKKMRGDFKMMVEGKSVESHMITDDTYSYSWSSMMPQGVKMKMAQIEAPTASPTSGQVDINNEVDMNCFNWGVDNSKFTPPSDIQFMDVSTMMKPASSPASGQTQQNQNSSVCDALTDPQAKSACKNAGY